VAAPSRRLHRRPGNAGGGVAAIDFAPTELQQSVRAAIEKICARFGDDYWLKRDSDGNFPDEFYRALAQDGWLGVCIPQAFGGSGLGVSEAAVMMQTVAAETTDAAADRRRQGKSLLRGDRA
jgi:alkylation response protein AidB-like acyl-CoA dehydrogenase